MSQPLQNRTNFYSSGTTASTDEGLISIFTSWLMLLQENKSDKHTAMGSAVLKHIWLAAPDTVSVYLSLIGP